MYYLFTCSGNNYCLRSRSSFLSLFLEYENMNGTSQPSVILTLNIKFNLDHIGPSQVEEVGVQTIVRLDESISRYSYYLSKLFPYLLWKSGQTYYRVLDDSILYPRLDRDTLTSLFTMVLHYRSVKAEARILFVKRILFAEMMSSCVTC